MEQPPNPAVNKVAENYKPTPSEADALRAYLAANNKRAPRLKMTSNSVGPDHANALVGQVALMKAVGTSDSDFFDGLIRQLINVGSPGVEPDEAGTNFMLSIVKGLQPRDQTEAMLAAQMAAVHAASMTFARRLAQAENIPQQDSADRAFNKLTRTFAAQVAALKDYRSKGEQKMTVQHVRKRDLMTAGGYAAIA